MGSSFWVGVEVQPQTFEVIFGPGEQIEKARYLENGWAPLAKNFSELNPPQKATFVLGRFSTYGGWVLGSI